MGEAPDRRLPGLLQGVADVVARRRTDESKAARRRADESKAARRRADESKAARRRVDESKAARRWADELRFYFECNGKPLEKGANTIFRSLLDLISEVENLQHTLRTVSYTTLISFRVMLVLVGNM